MCSSGHLKNFANYFARKGKVVVKNLLAIMSSEKVKLVTQHGSYEERRTTEPRLRVLVLSGWSPGPLTALQTDFHTSCEFLEPALPMPPMGCTWCFSIPCGLLVAWWVAMSLWGRELISVVPLRLLIEWVVAAMLAVLVVRDSIRRGVTIAERAIERASVDVVLGFSWGGGIACWLMAERRWEGPTLLLAPTVSAMARAARLKEPTFEGGTGEPASSDATPPVHIFHASRWRVAGGGWRVAGGPVARWPGGMWRVASGWWRWRRWLQECEG